MSSHTEQTASTTPTTSSSSSRRVRNMKKRYSNTSGAAAVVAAAVAQEQQQDEETDRRKSFALDMEKIPSFGELNGEFLFDDDDHELEAEQQQEEQQRSSSKRREPLRASSTQSSSRRRRSSTGKRGNSSNAPRSKSNGRQQREKRSSIQIQETKVVMQRVSRQEDVLFLQDDSGKSQHTETTASTSTHSSLEDDPFFVTSAHRSCGALELTFDDDESFFNSSPATKPKKEKDIVYLPAVAPAPLSRSKSASTAKYANLGTRMGARTTDDLINKATLVRGSSDTMAFTPITPKFVREESTRRESKSSRASHSRTTAAAPAAAAKPPQSPKQRSSRRRSSLGDESHCSGIPLAMPGGGGGKSEYMPLGGQQSDWSLRKLVGGATGQNRRALILPKRQQQHQQDQLCQEFFGEQ